MDKLEELNENMFSLAMSEYCGDGHAECPDCGRQIKITNFQDPFSRIATLEQELADTKLALESSEDSVRHFKEKYLTVERNHQELLGLAEEYIDLDDKMLLSKSIAGIIPLAENKKKLKAFIKRTRSEKNSLKAKGG